VYLIVYDLSHQNKVIDNCNIGTSEIYRCQTIYEITIDSKYNWCEPNDYTTLTTVYSGFYFSHSFGAQIWPNSQSQKVSFFHKNSLKIHDCQTGDKIVVNVIKAWETGTFTQLNFVTLFNNDTVFFMNQKIGWKTIVNYNIPWSMRAVITSVTKTSVRPHNSV
jgi:hypothetical protein